MSIGLQKLELLSYFNLPSTLFGKSIQRTYNFNAFFIDDPTNKLGNRKKTGPMPVILPWHFLKISIPTYSFSKENMVFGQVPISFPVLNLSNVEEMTISVDLEEDELGTIEFFITWCQRNIIDENGYYVPPLQNRIGHLLVEITDPTGIPVLYYTFRDLYFLDASEVTYDYGSNDSIVRTIRFGIDRVETMFTKYSAINTLQKSIFTRF